MTHLVLPLWAYLDPFAGSIILQVVAAFLIGSGVMLRRYLLTPIGWLFRRRRGHEQDVQSELYE